LKRRWVVVLGTLTVGSAVLAFLLVGGFLGRLINGGTAIPPCETLPSRAEVSRAISGHPELARQLSNAGDDIQITIGTPCDDPEAALVEVQVANSAEESRVDKVLTESEGFGVPVVITNG
jgi:hypothetical protein